MRCKLVSGPPGMTVSAGGRIEWAVPADFPHRSAVAIVSVADVTGQEVFKTFSIKVDE